MNLKELRRRSAGQKQEQSDQCVGQPIARFFFKGEQQGAARIWPKVQRKERIFVK